MRNLKMFVFLFGVVFVSKTATAQECTPEACHSNFGFPDSAHPGSCECRDATHPHAKKTRRGNVWTVTFRDPDGLCGCHYPETQIFASEAAADEGIELHALRHVAEGCTTINNVRLDRDVCPPCGRWINDEHRCDLSNCPNFRARFPAAPTPSSPPARVEDLCSNLNGVQEVVPEGRERRPDGQCVRRRVLIVPRVVPDDGMPPPSPSPPPPPRTGCAAVENRTNAERCDDCVATHGRFVRDRTTREYRCECGDNRALVGTECLGVEDVSRLCAPLLGAPQGTDEEQARHELLARNCTETTLGLQCLIRGQIVGESGACEDPVRPDDLDALSARIESAELDIEDLSTRVGRLEHRVDTNDAADRDLRHEVAEVRELAQSRTSSGGFDLEIRSGGIGYVGPASMMDVLAACVGGRGDWNAGRSHWGAHLEGDWCFAGPQAVSGAVGAHYTHRHHHRFGAGLFITVLDAVVDQTSDAEDVVFGLRLAYDYTPRWRRTHFGFWGEAGAGVFLDISPEQTVTPTVSGESSVGGGIRVFLRFR